MSVIQTKSISGITSITTPSGSDNLLTIHTSDTTERVRVNNAGDVIVGTGVTLSPDGDVYTTGIITATSFVGSGANLTGVASTENIRTNTNATFLQNINVSGSTTTGSLVSGGAVSGTTGTFSGALSGTTGTFTSHVSLGDSDKLKLGAEPDLEIYHSGSNAFFENATGNVYFRNDGSSTYFQMGSSNESAIVCAKDDYVGLFFNGGEKLATTATGVTLKSGAANTTKVIIGSTASRGLEISTVSDGSNNDAQVEFNAADATSSGYHANLVFKLAGAEKGRFHGNGDYFALSSTCTGITFKGDYADANRLDDYEEGTWTPTVAGGVTFNTRDGTYTKIGRMVMLTFRIMNQSASSGSSAVQITNAPFSSGSNFDAPGSSQYYKINFADGYSDYCNPYIAGSNIYWLRNSSASGSGNSLLASQCTWSGGGIMSTLVYHTDA